MVADDVATIVAGLVEQPSVDTPLVARIGDARRGRRAEGRAGVVRRVRSEVHAAVGRAPALEQGEGGFDPRAVALHAVADRALGHVALVARRALEMWHQHLPREEQLVGVLTVQVGRQSVIAAPHDLRDRERPAVATQAVARA
jgi:hypothetical protein